jgi:hypothetical protein
MPYQGHADGLYLVARRSPEKGVDHYGIVDIGNRFRLVGADGINPVVVHQRPPAIAAEWLKNAGPGDWRVLGKIGDEVYAIERLRQAAANPGYNLFGNNCEHFARFIATGVRQSTQLQVAGIVAGLAALAVVVTNTE